MTDEQFTKLFRVVPLNAKEMTRGPFDLSKNKYTKLYDNKQLVPFPSEWKNTYRYSSVKTDKVSPVMAAVIEPPLIFIDFDVKEHYLTALRLLHEIQLQSCYHAVAVGPDQEILGGHLGFRVNTTDVATFNSTTTSELNEKHYEIYLNSLLGAKSDNIDIQYNGRLIYLATSGNKTKKLISCPTTVNDFCELPESLVYFLTAIRPIERKIVQIQRDYDNSTFFQPKVKSLLLNAERRATRSDMIEFFSEFMPADYRGKISHPDELTAKLGEKPHDFLLKCSTKLGADPSIDQETYRNAMNAINSLCSPAKNMDDLSVQIIDRMVTGKAEIDGVSIWNYDENWQNKTLTITDRTREDVHSVYLVDNDSMYLMFNHTTADYQLLKKQDMTDRVTSLSGSTKAKIVEKIRPVTLVRDSQLDYGFFDKNRMFNSYRMSTSQKVARGILPTSDYEHPVEMLKYFETLVQDEGVREWLFRFWYTSLVTDWYTDVLLYFDGKGGSGKSLFSKLFAVSFEDVGEEGEPIESYHEMREDVVDDKYNEYMGTAKVIVCEEIGAYRDRRKAQKLANDAKAKTANMSVRRLGRPAIRVDVSAIYMFTSNEPLDLFKQDMDQRRLAFIKTPNALKDIFGSDGAIELLDKAYYNNKTHNVAKLVAYFVRTLKILPKSEFKEVPDYVRKSDWAMDFFQQTASFDKQVYAALIDLHENKGLKRLLKIPGITMNKLDIVERAGKGGFKMEGWSSLVVKYTNSSPEDGSLYSELHKLNISLDKYMADMINTSGILSHLSKSKKYVLHFKSEEIQTEDLNMTKSPKM